MAKVILASASPRRKELLEQIGVSFQTVPSRCEERVTKSRPEEVVTELAEQKAAAVADGIEDGRVVLGADTIVVFQGNILGKPENAEHAARMLSMLQGNTHAVYTGVCVIKTGSVTERFSFYEKTEVTMYPMSEKEIRDYVAGGEPMDKAGAYGIQGMGARFIQKISGDYSNVVGLPIGRLCQECRKRNILL